MHNTSKLQVPRWEALRARHATSNKNNFRVSGGANPKKHGASECELTLSQRLVGAARCRVRPSAHDAVTGSCKSHAAQVLPPCVSQHVSSTKVGGLRISDGFETFLCCILETARMCSSSTVLQTCPCYPFLQSGLGMAGRSKSECPLGGQKKQHASKQLCRPWPCSHASA